MKAAAALLVVWFVAHYAWMWAPIQHQGAVFNIYRSAASLALVGMVALAIPSRLVLVPVAGIAAEEAQVIGCGTWWLIDPWIVKPGDELCSSGLGIPLGAIGLALLGVAAYWLKGRHARSSP